MTDRVRWMHQERLSHDRQRISHQQRMDLGDGVCRALQASCSQLSRWQWWQESAKIIRGRWGVHETGVIDKWMHLEPPLSHWLKFYHQQRMDLGDGVCRALWASCSQLSRWQWWQESAKIIREPESSTNAIRGEWRHLGQPSIPKTYILLFYFYYI